jgi:hypothetical protein
MLIHGCDRSGLVLPGFASSVSDFVGELAWCEHSADLLFLTNRLALSNDIFNFDKQVRILVNLNFNNDLPQSNRDNGFEEFPGVRCGSYRTVAICQERQSTSGRIGPARGKLHSPATGLSDYQHYLLSQRKCDSPQPTTILDNFLDADWCHFPSCG